jgi:hypothetical protein
MSSKTHKTGLAGLMRKWMKGRTGTKTERRFTIGQICEALSIPPGRQHKKVATALEDFEKRGEISSWVNQKHKRRQYVYVHDWMRAKQGMKNRRIFKSMYVSTSFAVTDIQRLSGVKERDWIDKIVRHLKRDGYLQQIARRHCAHGAGAENIYHIISRDKFKLERMNG